MSVSVPMHRQLTLGETWLEAEEKCYPDGGFKRRAHVRLRRNKHNPIELPYGELRVVTASIPVTAFTIPARLRHRGLTIRGFVSVQEEELAFTPEADPSSCSDCEPKRGCRRDT